jgi:hypothetical protein
MMSQFELHKMYQAWQQGNDNYVRDWAKFVEWAARWNSETTELMKLELEKCPWFVRPKQ